MIFTVNGERMCVMRECIYHDRSLAYEEFWVPVFWWNE